MFTAVGKNQAPFFGGNENATHTESSVVIYSTPYFGIGVEGNAIAKRKNMDELPRSLHPTNESYLSLVRVGSSKSLGRGPSCSATVPLFVELLHMIEFAIDVAQGFQTF